MTDPPAPAIRITISAGGRDVSVDAVASLPEVRDAALSIWHSTARSMPKTRLEAGGIGFETERAAGPVYGHDAPGIL